MSEYEVTELARQFAQFTTQGMFLAGFSGALAAMFVYNAGQLLYSCLMDWAVVRDRA